MERTGLRGRPLGSPTPASGAVSDSKSKIGTRYQRARKRFREAKTKGGGLFRSRPTTSRRIDLEGCRERLRHQAEPFKSDPEKTAGQRAQGNGQHRGSLT
jgi:hypothetical protein